MYDSESGESQADESQLESRKEKGSEYSLLHHVRRTYRAFVLLLRIPSVRESDARHSGSVEMRVQEKEVCVRESQLEWALRTATWDRDWQCPLSQPCSTTWTTATGHLSTLHFSSISLLSVSV